MAQVLASQVLSLMSEWRERGLAHRVLVPFAVSPCLFLTCGFPNFSPTRAAAVSINNSCCVSHAVRCGPLRLPHRTVVPHRIGHWQLERSTADPRATRYEIAHLSFSNHRIPLNYAFFVIAKYLAGTLNCDLTYVCLRRHQVVTFLDSIMGVCTRWLGICRCLF